MRIKAIDSVRGLAVLFLFMVNIPIWTTAAPDSFLEMIRDGMLDGWLYMAFSCMFGASLILANDSPKPFYKRMAILFTIGMIHGIFLNYMDILAVYAVLGIWSFSFRKSSEKRLFFYGLGFFFVPIVVYGLLAFFVPESIRYSEQNPIDFLERARLWFPMLVSQIIFHSWEIMGMMLLGMAMIKVDFFNEDKFAMLKTSLVIALPIAIVLMLAYAYFKMNNQAAISAVLYFIAAPILSLSVISIVTRFNLYFFANLGKISLSLYFIQSIAGFFLFIVLGLEPSVQEQLIIGVLAIIGMIIAAPLLVQFRPLERVYRLATK